MKRLREFDCNNCAKRRDDICGKDKDNRSLPEDKLGCDEGSWVVKMTKWKGYVNNKEPPVYVVTWDWLIRVIITGKEEFKRIDINI